MLADFGDLDGFSLASSHGDQMFLYCIVLLDFSCLTVDKKKKINK